VAVADIRPVKGVEEKVYRLARMPRIEAKDAARLNPDDYVRYLTTFLVTVLHNFSVYIRTTSHPDLQADLAGFTEVQFYATDAEFAQAITTVNEAIIPLTRQGPGPGRRKRALSTVTHPVPDPPTGEDPDHP
jgi:hypothetical protein